MGRAGADPPRRALTKPDSSACEDQYVRAAFAATVVLAALVAGCGGSAHAHGKKPSTDVRPAPKLGRTVPLAPAGAPAPAAIAVIKGWANALRNGNVAAAAGYFAIPSIYANGVGANGRLLVLRIRSRAGAVEINRELPCGAIFVSAAPHGPYIRAVFRLTGRPGPGGTSCTPGVGSEATTFFQIAHGKIADWIRGPNETAPTNPGTGTTTGPKTGTGPTPPTTTTPGGGVPVA
jgi:hypothetical protein